MNNTLICALLIMFTLNACGQKPNSNNELNDSKINQNTHKMNNQTVIDNSKKSILARGCDPNLSLRFSKVVPALVGNATYVPTTDDTDFINKLNSKKWSVIYFAPGACRYSADDKQIPGANIDTQGWSIEQYKELIYKLQGDDIQIVESIHENGAIELLNNALEISIETK